MLTQRDLDWFFGRTNNGQVARYPLTNLGFDDNETLHIEVAVAGFDKNDIEIEQKGNRLYITGNQKLDKIKTNINYIQEHISSNNFERIIVLHENYVGGDITANVLNGILTIEVKPKEPTRKLIAIGE